MTAILTLNVGQGSLSVARDNDDVVIVDSHIPARGDRDSEYVKGALQACTRDRYVRGFVLTGFDADHINVRGVAYILRKYRPDWIMYPKYYKPSNAAREAFKVIETERKARANTSTPLERIPIRLDNPGTRFFDRGKLSADFAFELFSPHPQDMDSSNNCSLVAKVTGRDLSYLVTGDTENERWHTINRIFGDALSADVLAAPHHGSKNGINAHTMQLVRPEAVHISCGPSNQYGHPHYEALLHYHRHARDVFKTSDGHSIQSFRRAGRVHTHALQLT